MKVVAVVPAYNEATVIGAVVRGLRQFVDAVIVVDDGSTDQTGLVAATEGVIVLQHFLNRGQGAALQTGILAALQQGADIIVTFDADGQHDANDIPKLIASLQSGQYDVVLGSRFLGQGIEAMPISRRWLLKIAVVFDCLRTGLQISDTHNGLRAFSRAAAEQLHITQDGMAHASEILDEIAHFSFCYTEVPVSVSYTPYARAKGQQGKNSLAILRDILLKRT